VEPSPHPDKWRLRDIFINAFVLGLYLSVSSIVFFYVIIDLTWFPDTFGVYATYNVSNPIQPDSQRLNGIMYLQVSITGQLVIFNTRTRSWFWTSRPSYFLMSAFVVAQLVATLIAVYANWEFTQLYPIGWSWAAVVWVWSICWSLPLDIPKIITRRLTEEEGFSFGSTFEQFYHGAVTQRGVNVNRSKNRGSRGNSVASNQNVQRSRRASMAQMN
jgi:H+-transporting ATPase